MQQEKDFILREIQRLTLLLTHLIRNALGLKANDFEQGFQNIELALKSQFDLTLKEISEMENSELTVKINDLNNHHLEKLVELIHILAPNPQSDFGQKLAHKGILILDYLDKNSGTFSLKRMELRKTLQQKAQL